MTIREQHRNGESGNTAVTVMTFSR